MKKPEDKSAHQSQKAVRIKDKTIPGKSKAIKNNLASTLCKAIICIRVTVRLAL